MNKIYFNIKYNTANCTPFIKSGTYSLKLSTIIHDYFLYLMQINPNFKRPSSYKKHFSKNNFHFENACTKAFIVSNLKQTGGFVASHYRNNDRRTQIVQIKTGSTFLTGSTNPSKHLAYSYYFKYASVQLNSIDIEIFDPDYLISAKELSSIRETSSFLFDNNLVKLKAFGSSLFRVNEYWVIVEYDNGIYKELEDDDLSITCGDGIRVIVSKKKINKNKPNNILFGSNEVFNGIEKYHLSRYNINFSYDGKNYLFNTRSGNLVAIKNKELQTLKQELPSCSHDILNNLINLGFLTNSNNEFKDVEQENYEALQKNKFFSITIAPTFKCNAKCEYCFEKGIKCEDEFDEKTMDKVIKYIEDNHDDKKVHITWFGGEPLLAAEKIELFINKLKSKNIDLYSTMISNGYFVDKYIDLLSKKIELKKIQITIDDIEEKYEQIKGLGPKSFQKIINNIHLLIENNVPTVVRINFDSSEYQNAIDLIDYLYNEFKNQIKVYVHEIIGEDFKSPLEIQENPLITLYSKLIKYGYIKDLYQMQLKRSYAPCSLNSKSFVIVSPNGDLTKCEHYVGKESQFSCGNINDDCLKTNKYFEKPNSCSSCICFPICGGGCFSNHLIRRNYGCLNIKNIVINIIKMYLKSSYESNH